MGFDIRVFSIKNPMDKVHPFVEKIQAPVCYLPKASWKRVGRFIPAHLFTLLHRPGGYLRCLRHALKRRSSESMKKFMLAGYASRGVISGDIRHLHAHFASGSTRLAKYIHLMTGVPFSFTAHAKDIFTDRVSRGQLKRRLQTASFVVTISEYNRKHLEEICPEADIHVIRNGIPVDNFPLNNGEPGLEPRPIILSVGRLIEKKGFPFLVDACALLRDRGKSFSCSIVGHGPLREEIEGRIHRHGLEEYVHLRGSCTQDELVQAHYRKATVFTLPCVEAQNGDKDGLPVAIEEAMAMGIPVVSTPITGIPELIRHNRTGLLVSPSDSEGLARALELLLDDEGLRERLKAAARDEVEREYHIDRTIQRLAGLFEGVSRCD